MPLRAIYYDTETTGIKSDRDRVIEIAAYDPVNDLRFEKLVKPGIPIPPEATAIHQISDQMVAEAPSFQEMLPEFLQFCAGDVVLIAHNNDAFDIHFLKAEFGRANAAFPDWKFLDTLKWARRYRKDLPRHSLQFLREVYGIPANNAHRALDDVLVLHQVFSYLIDDLSIEDAYQLLNAERALHHMPFGKYQGTPLKNLPKDYVQWLVKNGAFEKPENKELRTALEKLGVLASL
jgi:DNA polymerase III subunit epsilon